MKKIVISQPMFFPWKGLFEQIALSDDFVHFDDVMLPQGRSFMNRVQIKTEKGTSWLTVPIKRNGKQLIKDVKVDQNQNWKEHHLKLLHHAYARSEYVKEMIEVVKSIYSLETENLSDLNIYAIERISEYFQLTSNFYKSTEIGTVGKGTEKIFNIVKKLGASTYITGHGAKNYLDHQKFDDHGVEVEYMNYRKHPYNQLHNEFTPYVSILDLIANCGQEGKKFINSDSESWKSFI